MNRIAAAKIHPNPLQPRRNFDETALRELAESIRTQGLIQPIKVMPHPERPGEWMLVDDGERRLRAMRDVLGWEELEVGRHVVIVEDGLSEVDRLARAVAANLQRQDLNPIESARALQRLHGMGLSDGEIAKRLGKSRAWVANRRRLLQLPPEVQEKVASGELPERRARALLTWLKYREDIPQDLVRRLQSWSNDPHDIVWWYLTDQGRKLPWPPDFAPEADTGHVGPCQTCRYYGEREEKRYCLAPSGKCFSARKKAWIQMELARVSAETGIPIPGPEENVRYPEGVSEQYAWLEAVAEALEQGGKPPEYLRLLPVREGWHRLGYGSRRLRSVFGPFVTLGCLADREVSPSAKRLEHSWSQEERIRREVARALIPAARQLAERIRQTLTPETELWLRRLLNVVHLPTTETLRHWPRKEAKAAEEDLWLALAVALITPLERFWLGPRDSVEAYRNWLWERLRENLAALGAEDLMQEVKK